MNPITLGKAISEYGTPIITAVMLILVVGLVWYLIKRQTKREDKHDKIQAEDREFNKELITNTLKEIHTTGIKNSELSRKSISMQKQFAKESVGTLKTICDRLNGGTEGIRAIALLKEINERKRNIKVKVDRRK